MKNIFDVNQSAEVAVAVHEALSVAVDGSAVKDSLIKLNESLVAKDYTPGSVEPYIPINPTDVVGFYHLTQSYKTAFDADAVYLHSNQFTNNFGSRHEVLIDSVNRRLPPIPYTAPELFPETDARAMLLGREHSDPNMWATDADDKDGLHFTGQTSASARELLGNRALLTPADIVVLAAQRLIQGRALPYGSLTTDYLQYPSGDMVMNSFVNTDNHGINFSDLLTTINGIRGVRISLSADSC